MIRICHILRRQYLSTCLLEKEDTDRLAKIETDMWDYIYRKRAEWITGGKIDEEWEEYLAELERVGLEEWIQIKQTGYDNF